MLPVISHLESVNVAHDKDAMTMLLLRMKIMITDSSGIYGYNPELTYTFKVLFVRDC